MDAAFLYGETANAPLNVIGAIVLESRSRRAGADFERVRAQIASRLDAMPVLRRRLLEVPLGIDHPMWSDDPHFDLDDHVFRGALRPPGGDRELERHVARLAETPLRRDRPLWEIHVVEGLAGRRLALLAKLHHAAVDGLGGVEILAALLDADPEGKALVPAAPPEPAPAPTPLEVLGEAALGLGARPLRGARQLLRGGRLGARWAWSALTGQGGVFPPAPATRLNGPVSSRRVVATGSVSLDDVLAIKRAHAATVNHVVLAACAGALRRYLAAHGGVPRQPLVAAVPMALGERRPDAVGNALSVLLVRLPVHRARALDRLAEVREASLEARRLHEEMGPQLGDWADLATPLLVSGASQLYHRLGLAAHHPPFHNVVISNVPGPREPLYCAGSRVTACHPFGPIYDGWGLNLTVMSYAGRIALGVLACPERVPDAEGIARAFEACVAQLRRRVVGPARLRVAQPQGRSCKGEARRAVKTTAGTRAGGVSRGRG